MSLNSVPSGLPLDQPGTRFELDVTLDTYARKLRDLDSRIQALQDEAGEYNQFLNRFTVPDSALPDLEPLHYARQTSGLSLSAYIPAGKLTKEGDVLEIEVTYQTGTLGNPNLVCTQGGGTVIAAVAVTANQTHHLVIRIGYVSETTCWFSHTRFTSAGTLVAAQSESLTVDPWGNASLFSVALSGGTAPEIRTLRIHKINGPIAA